MELRTYRAGTIQEALQQVRQELGPEAAVLHTREVPRGLFRWLGRGRQIEVTAAIDVHVPSRLPPEEPFDQRLLDTYQLVRDDVARVPPGPPPGAGPSSAGPSSAGPSYAGPSSAGSERAKWKPAPDSFELFTGLIDAELSEELARELIDQLIDQLNEHLDDSLTAATGPAGVWEALTHIVQRRIPVGGPIQVTPGRRRTVALVGPTGVGKTTTIAKLAANFHLREGYQVGLITVDTYRIAAVEQLRTYAEIIDLPMEVVSTPREMRQAVERLAHLDLVLVDTAGRSPRDAVRIQELKSFLTEARADEVHLVLSSVGSLASLCRTAAEFARVGTSSLLLTKLDEATGLGSLLPLLADCGLPLSYVTNGQNVPDDIVVADRRQLARFVLGQSADQDAMGAR